MQCLAAEISGILAIQGEEALRTPLDAAPGEALHEQIQRFGFHASEAGRDIIAQTFLSQELRREDIDKVFIGSRQVWDEEAEELLLRALEDQQSIAESHWWRSQVHIEPFKGPVVLRGEAAHLYLTAEVCTLVAWL